MKSLKGFFKGFGKGFKNFGNGIVVIVNSALLSVVYLIGVGITSIIARIFRKRFLDIRNSRDRKKAKTYWKDLDLKKEPIDNYYRQF